MSKEGDFKIPFPKGKKGKNKASISGAFNDDVKLEMVFNRPDMKAELDKALNDPGALNQLALQESVRDLNLNLNKGISASPEIYTQDSPEEDKESLESNRNGIEEEDTIPEHVPDVSTTHDPSPMVLQEDNQGLKEKLSRLNLESHYSRQSLSGLLRSECEELGIPKIAFGELDDDPDPVLPGTTLCVDHTPDLSVEGILGVVTMVTRCYRKFYKSIVLSSTSPRPGRILFQVMKMSDYQNYEENIGPKSAEMFMELVQKNTYHGCADLELSEEEYDRKGHDTKRDEQREKEKGATSDRETETCEGTDTTRSFASATSQPELGLRNVYIILQSRKGPEGLKIPIDPDHHKDVLSAENVRDGIKVRTILNRLGLLERYRIKYDIKNALLDFE